MRPPKSDSWLIKYSDQHLLHELKMFWWLAAKIQSHSENDGYTQDALLESFVVHLRNLIYFFCGKKKQDYVIAAHFLDQPGEWTERESLTLKSASIRASKELSHLTTRRKDEGDLTKRWDVVGLFKEIEALAKKFVAKASPKKLSADVRELLNAPDDQLLLVLGAHFRSSNVTAQVITVSSDTTGSWRKGP